MSAMTWFDHETRSIWSQPWGRGIKGPYKGVLLDLLPFQLTTWERWKESYPHTLVMTNDTEFLGLRRQGFQPDFVIGLTLGTDTKAYYFTDVEGLGVVNDWLGDVPVLVWADKDIYHAYVRIVAGETLTFWLDGKHMVDQETGSRWDPALGLAVSGQLAGQALKPVPSLSSFDWAWEDFYPDSTFFQPE